MSPLRVKPRASSFRCVWEMTALRLCLVVWGDTFTEEFLHLVRDTVGALSNALNLKGRGPSLAGAREITWRRARRRWRCGVGRIASEASNSAARLRKGGYPPVRRPARAHLSVAPVGSLV